MPDRYQQLVNTPVGRVLAKRAGLPAPPPLRRHRPGRAVIEGAVLLGAPAGARSPRLAQPVAEVLQAIDADVDTPMEEAVRTGAARAQLHAGIFNPDAAPADRRFAALVLDATGLGSSEELVEAWAFLHPAIRRVTAAGRVIVLGTPPQDAATPEEAIAQRALEGLVRALGKEVRTGATAQLVSVAPGAEDRIASTLRFLLSARSAFVSGQVVRIDARVALPGKLDWERPLHGKVALVTGAARGIGEAIAELLARDGAHVVGVDVEPMAGELATLAERLGGASLTADITDADAPARIADELGDGVDVVVHNAGITRDRTMGRMTREQWTSVLAVNLTAPQRINAELLHRKAIHRNGRIVGVSSISGIAGNAGQTNYSTSKAGVIGLVETAAPALVKRGITVNAVAPGFIETRMTAAMPFALREAGRRMSSVSQGGLPVDVAETVAWLAAPASAGITGNVVRVCGQSLIGA